MRLFIRLLFSALAIYVVVTASEQHKAMMMTGLRGLAGAAGDACTRNALCNEVVGKAIATIQATSQRMRHSSIDRGPALFER